MYNNNKKHPIGCFLIRRRNQNILTISILIVFCMCQVGTVLVWLPWKQGLWSIMGSNPDWGDFFFFAFFLFFFRFFYTILYNYKRKQKHAQPH